MSKINHKLTISSPYIVKNKRSRKLMQDLLRKNVDITLFTNSLASTDSIYVAVNLYKSIFKWAKLGITTYVHPGTFMLNTPILDEKLMKNKWGTHAKTHIYDNIDNDGNIESEVMIGTYNVDHRSIFYNNEMALFCKGNPELVEEIRESMHSRINQSYKTFKNKTARMLNGKKVSVYGVHSRGSGKLWYLAFPAWLIKSLL